MEELGQARRYQVERQDEYNVKMTLTYSCPCGTQHDFTQSYSDVIPNSAQTTAPCGKHVLVYLPF